jgi:hypothetical protein
LIGQAIDDAKDPSHAGYETDRCAVILQIIVISRSTGDELLGRSLESDLWHVLGMLQVRQLLLNLASEPLMAEDLR